jgi:hypothetical protein
MEKKGISSHAEAFIGSRRAYWRLANNEKILEQSRSE